MVNELEDRIGSIYAPVKGRLSLVERRIRTLSSSNIPNMDTLLDHVLSSGGKRVRAALTLLSSEFYTHDEDYPIIMAAAVELLHLATLIHDDTVDNSDMRRGKATVSNLWGKHIAVLFGDYVFAASATFVCDTYNVRVIRRFSETIMELASGEIIEYFNCYDPTQSREAYNDRIYRKTASLFCTAAETGAILGGAPEDQIQALRSYAHNIGMAFQLVDDLLDIEGDAGELGKPVGNDLLHGVLTLPSIMLLERSPWKSPSDNPIEALFKYRGDSLDEVNQREEKLECVLEMITRLGIIDECSQVIRGYCTRANECLAVLPQCPAYDSLSTLASFMLDRTK